MAYMLQVREKLHRDLVEQMQAVSDGLSSGRAVDYSDYKRMVGRIQGLRQALDIVDAVFNKALNEDEGE